VDVTVVTHHFVLSTHVLDVSRGRPAAGLVVELHLVTGSERQRLTAVTTNVDGRTDDPLLSGDRLQAGVYELTFRAGDYFRKMNVPLTNPPFLDDIVIRIGVAEGAGSYHVPLLLSPYGYSTYRGS
jgi:5-hydroxyisourate hydrolase